MILINPYVKTITAIFYAAALVAITAVIYNEIFLWATTEARDRFFANPFYTLFAVPFLFLCGAYLCRRFAPKAVGSGVENVISSLKELESVDNIKDGDYSKYLSPKVLIVAICSSIACVFGGGALGREGPAVQISAGIFAFAAKKLKETIPKIGMRMWIIAGSSAGFAAAFNAPIAGIIFAVEELALNHLELEL